MRFSASTTPRSTLLNPRGDRYVTDGYRQLLPLGDGVEQHLRGVITDALAHPGSLLRAHLAYSVMERHGVAPELSRSAAVAIEYFHTASLIFDDMPSMDNAVERRGHTCPHVAHGEAAATLGALALINQGYALLWQVIGTLPEQARADASHLVSSCLGVAGVLNGQSLDLHFNGAELAEEEVLKVAEGKTVSLIRLTLLLPAIIAGADADARGRLDRLSTVWGLAYQVVDDFKDCLMSGAETGKSTSRDQLLGRPNLPGQTGLERALERLNAFLTEGREIVSSFSAESWPQLGVLQGILEDERAKVVDHFPTALRKTAWRKMVWRQTVLRGRLEPDVLSFVDRQLSRWAGHEKTLIVTMPAPRVAAEALLFIHGQVPGFLWEPGLPTPGLPTSGLPTSGLSAVGRKAAWAGVGAAHRIQLDGEDRFHQLRQRADQVWRRLVVASLGDSQVPTARLHGGLAFDTGAAEDELWQGFGDGVFTLPRLLYSQDADQAWLSLAVRGEEIDAAVEQGACLAMIEETLAALSTYGEADREASPGSPDLAWIHRPSMAGWIAEIEAIRAAIGEGRFAKIVAAQCSRVVFDAPLDVARILQCLASGPDVSTRFAFRGERSSFLGLTPERLVSLRGRNFATEALAGSSRSGSEHTEKLLASAKDRHEHQLVVGAIAERLQPISRQLDVAGPPRVRALGQVSHLQTPIVGVLDRPRHVLDLVETLHPTPAVGGVPTAGAKSWIRQHEARPRGWYASPVGWFDADGNGDFAVALRSAVIRGREAHVFAGAGIVADSDPQLEYAETELKLQTMLAALGA